MTYFFKQKENVTQMKSETPGVQNTLDLQQGLKVCFSSESSFSGFGGWEYSLSVLESFYLKL